ncbi:formate dehydrogenase accessory sulfurtransferase FdhD [Flectobacillus sp. BAB-3569]|uniref:formate dehydrogenase accessory sulfurtransferase FdhD n=1 Tax=Flectobacillus sp. BAB-3569 TaxID=1509483 RepID=UPI000BA43AD2|nr:formate dehydrogenase accessory sulfurtransferase FdhD [Flectobacillus sp. BAB-3569]PAC27221.1 sulfurtransferase FdhD [Flectobacillus sp. BAB-3569]
MQPRVKPVQVIKYSSQTPEKEMDDLVIIEEPLAIRIGYGAIHQRLQKNLSVTMRTPGHDFELTLGFLYSEGIIQHLSQVQSIRYCTELQRQEEHENIVRVELSPDLDLSQTLYERNFMASSSCGICGKAQIESLEQQQCLTLNNWEYHISPTFLWEIEAKLTQNQTLFSYTGGAHAVAIYENTGELVLLREDIGRHNALDKVIGAKLGLEKQAIAPILVLSSRVSYEMIQKSIMAQFPIIVAVGAPSSLAVELAQQFGITLIAFLRKGKFNVYSHEYRVQ